MRGPMRVPSERMPTTTGRCPICRRCPADPRWRVEHLPFLTAVSVALMLCAGSVGFLVGRPAAAARARRPAWPIVTVSFTMSTLVIAWADTVRPACSCRWGSLTYVSSTRCSA